MKLLRDIYPLLTKEKLLVKTQRLKPHPFALMFPQDSEQIAHMEKSICKLGVLVKIVLFQGKILDGYTRYRIAEKHGIPVKTEDYHGSPEGALSLACSYNLCRRRLNPTQLGIIAENLFQQYLQMGIPEDEAIGRAIEETGASNDYFRRASKLSKKETAACLNGTTTMQQIQDEKTIEAKAVPELKEAVKNGHISRPKAAKIAHKKPEEQIDECDWQEQARDSRDQEIVAVIGRLQRLADNRTNEFSRSREGVYFHAAVYKLSGLFARWQENSPPKTKRSQTHDDH